MATVTTPGETAVNEFVSMLKSRMDVLNLNPRQLAAKANVGFPYLYRVLKGEQTPSIDWAARVGRHVGLQIRTIESPKKQIKKVS